MTRHVGLLVSILAANLAGITLPSPAVALLPLQAGSLLGARAFVRDSLAPVRAMAMRPVVAFGGAGAAARALTPDAASRLLAHGEVRVTRVSESAALPQAGERNHLGWMVPLEIQIRDAAGTPHVLSPRVEMIGTGLEWNRALGRYTGLVRVWLEDRSAPSSGYALEAPVALEIGGEASDYEPPRWEVRNAGFPSRDVQIALARPRATNSIQIKVAATSSDQQTTLEASTAALTMPLVGDPMVVRPARQSVQGWGLEEAEVTISTSPSTREHPLEAVLTCARGTPRGQQVPIDALGQAVAHVRSGAPGLDTLWVDVGEGDARYALIDARPPWVFLLWALGGGLLGTLLRSLQSLNRRSKNATRRFVIELIVGVLAGLLMMGLYQVGFPILPGLAKGQSGGMLTGVVAALGGFLGRHGIEGMLVEKQA